jgi:fido (protein-threonine AMPylation protein)
MVSRSVGRENVEHRLAEMLRKGGEGSLNELRDKACHLAPALGLFHEWKVLEKLIGALLKSQEGEVLSAPTAIAYVRGESYEPARLETFEALRAALAVRIHTDRPDPIRSGEGFSNIAFFDAYFSNYIEGTEFEVEEALDIVFRNQIPQSRPDDAHDILGTWRVVSSTEEMSHVPKDFDEFLKLLRRRHRIIMEGRPGVAPGEFKEKPNRAGSTHFVHPGQVRGTLRKGFEYYQSLDHPFSRALFMKFMVAEVHPFQDGNGRTARAMMNADLVGMGQRRILIPSVYRTEYMGSLKRLTNHKDPGGYIRVMDYAQEFSHRIDFRNLTEARRDLESCNAFKDPSEGAKLRMPSAMG